MQLDRLVYWQLSGTPDVFTEMRDGVEWRVISHGQPHDAGFMQRVTFERPVQRITLLVGAELYTTGQLMLRLGIDRTGQTNPVGREVRWGGWLGPANGWSGEFRVLEYSMDGLNTNTITVFLRSATGGWPTRANTSRWQDVQLEVEYAEPDPEPDPETGLAGQIAAMHAEITGYLEQIEKRVIEVDRLLAEWKKGQAWVDEYNRRIEE